MINAGRSLQPLPHCLSVYPFTSFSQTSRPTRDPAYRQAATEVQAEIIKQDAKAIQSIFSQQEMASVNKMIPFSRYPLIKVLIQKHINFTKANIEEAQKQGFPQKEIDFLRQKLNKLETTKQDFLKRHSKEYQQQAINQRLAQLKQKAQ